MDGLKFLMNFIVKILVVQKMKAYWMILSCLTISATMKLIQLGFIEILRIFDHFKINKKTPSNK